MIKVCCLFGICLLIGTTEYLICIPRVNLGLSEQARKEFNMGYLLCTYSSMYVQRWKHKILHKKSISIVYWYRVPLPCNSIRLLNFFSTQKKGFLIVHFYQHSAGRSTVQMNKKMQNYLTYIAAGATVEYEVRHILKYNSWSSWMLQLQEQSFQVPVISVPILTLSCYGPRFRVRFRDYRKRYWEA